MFHGFDGGWEVLGGKEGFEVLDFHFAVLGDFFDGLGREVR